MTFRSNSRATSSRKLTRRAILKATAGTAATLALTQAAETLAEVPAKTSFNPFAAPVNTGPSSKTVPGLGGTPPIPGSPYLVPFSGASKWQSTSLLTAGNEINGYAMVGTPDGLGAFDNGDGSITVLMNHEIGGSRGKKREHGGTGAFVSRWVIDKNSLEVKSGRDFLGSPSKLHLWTGTQWQTADAPDPDPNKKNLTRLCSADLAPISAYFNTRSGKGYDGRIFLNGEEDGAAANRAFAWVVADGTAFELPAFSFGKKGDKMDPPPRWENLLAHPATGDATVVVAQSDNGPNRVCVYIGEKRSSGTPIEKAGLVGGRLYGLRVADIEVENSDHNVGLGKSRVGSGKGLRVSLVDPRKGTSFLRPEDGAWDPRRPDVYYFVTTHRQNLKAHAEVDPNIDRNQVGRSRLWAVTFDDVRRIATDGKPTAKIELLLDGTEGGDMFDNITIDRTGRIYLCEDTGSSRHNNRVWIYDTNSGGFAPIMWVDPEKFGLYDGKISRDPTPPFGLDKEASGILDVTEIFSAARWFRKGGRVLLVTVQASLTAGAVSETVVNGGQLLLLTRAP